MTEIKYNDLSMVECIMQDIRTVKLALTTATGKVPDSIILGQNIFESLCMELDDMLMYRDLTNSRRLCGMNVTVDTERSDGLSIGYSIPI